MSSNNLYIRQFLKGASPTQLQQIIEAIFNDLAALSESSGGSGAKTNISTVDPTPNNDSSEGYSVFSIWQNTTSGNISICTDASVNNAVWRYIYLQ